MKVVTKKQAPTKLNNVYCIDVLEGLQQQPSNSSQIIIADPPYNIGKDFGNGSDEREHEEYLKWCDAWINECIRVLKPNGTMFIYGFSEILAYIFVRVQINKKWLVWHYTNKNMPTVTFWQRSHESLICCWKEDKVFNKDSVREPYTEGFINGSAGKKRPGSSIGRLSKNGIDTVYNAHPNGALPRDVIKLCTLAGGSGMSERWFICKTCNTVCKPKELKQHQNQHHDIMKHPTQKPMDLCNKLILSAKQKDGYVLVPFAGVGSECVSAQNLGLNFIGFETNKNYVKIARERLVWNY